MVIEFNNVKIFDYIFGREFNSFLGFIDFFLCIKIVDLYVWIIENRERLLYEVLS